ncbi:MAG: DUF4232 domain-containing protein [Actinomycetes bacterium]
MNDEELDRSLLEYGERWRRVQAPAPPPRVEPQRFPRWAVPVAVAAAAAVIAGGISVAVSRHDHPAPPAAHSVDLRGTIPWAPLPPPPAYLPDNQRAVPLPPANAPACRSDQVSVKPAGGDGATGHDFTYFAFRNTSRSTCLLSGFPRVIAHQAGQRDVVATHARLFGSKTANLAPGKSAMLTIETTSPGVCMDGGSSSPSSRVYDHSWVVLPGGAKSLGGGWDLTCGEFDVSTFYVNEQFVNVPIPLAGLQAKLDVPARVQAASTLTYVADLTNSTNHTITLPRNCLAYMQTLSPEPAATPTPPATLDKRKPPWAAPPPVALVKEPYGLNCGPARTMRPHETVRYEMRMNVPSAALGRAGLFWSLNGVSLPTARAFLTILPPR